MASEHHFEKYGVRLRYNSYPPSEKDGSAVSERLPLKSALMGLGYRYVVDRAGQWHLMSPVLDLSHSALVASGEPVFSAGVVWIDNNNTVHVNCASGHYIAEDPFLGDEIEGWRNAMRESILEQGLIPGRLETGFQELR